MILYLDTSCLAKLFFEEQGSLRMEERVAEARIIVTSVITFPEMCSALARRRREGTLGESIFKSCLEEFRKQWPELIKVQADDRVISDAGDLALRHKLRGMDAIHLASGVQFRNRNSSIDIEFLSADEHLNAAARKEGFRGY